MSELTEDELKNNYREVKERIAEAAKRAGRDPKEVTLLAVSKTKPVSNIRTLMAEGQRAFGENYVQELTEKISEIGDAAEWHMIGHLQRNKVKYIIGKVRLIHAVDSVRLAEQIEKEAVKTGSEADVLMEVNIAREESKWGFMEEEALDAAHEIAAFPHVHLHGLMTSAPIAENPEDNRKYCFDGHAFHGHDTGLRGRRRRRRDDRPCRLCNFRKEKLWSERSAVRGKVTFVTPGR